MSSQNKFITPLSVHVFCFSLQWVFMVAFIITLIEWIDTLKLIDFVPSIAFLHFTLRFHTLPNVYFRDVTANYNARANELNSLPRIKRRRLIRDYIINNKK